MWMQVTALAVICVFILQDSAWAADAASSSGWSTLAYLLSLLVIFGFVVVMAYFAARFIGGHFGKSVSRHGGRLLVSLPLGPKSSAAIVEIAGRTFLLGVTESNVSMLAEITDPQEIEALERESAMLPQQEAGTMFTSQLGTLADFVSRFRKS